MSRDAKRNPRFLIGVGSIIFIGHWLDVNMMVMPGSLGHDFHGVGLLGDRHVHAFWACSSTRS
jgi:hypothetical protein